VEGRDGGAGKKRAEHKDGGPTLRPATLQVQAQGVGPTTAGGRTTGGRSALPSPREMSNLGGLGEDEVDVYGEDEQRSVPVVEQYRFSWKGQRKRKWVLDISDDEDGE